MLNTAFSPWPNYTEEEADEVRKVLLSNKVNYWTGSECQEFEKEFARWVGVKHAVALSNGTIALDAALRAIGISEGDEVIVTSRTFIASASTIIMAGGTPIFADVDEDSQNITAKTIRTVLTPRTKAIICVHLAGWPCDMDPIMSLAEEHGLFVIEDCAQAHGAMYKGKSVGSLGHIGAWSFCQDKIMTTGGEGGIVTTNDRQLWSLMWSYKDHGKSWAEVFKDSPHPEQEVLKITHQPEFRWLHHSFGTNGRMLELQAVLGRHQLKKMPLWHNQRLKNARQIWETASRLKGLRVPQIPAEIEHAAYKCYLFVKKEELNPEWNRSRIIEAINDRNVPCYYGSCPEVYLEKAFDNLKSRPTNRLPVARQLGETSLMFLVHPTLTNVEIGKTCQVLEEVMTEATS